jgi:hypothetical protein
MRKKEEPKVDEIINGNSKAFERLRDMAKELETVVEHESRIVGEQQPSDPDKSSA